MKSLRIMFIYFILAMSVLLVFWQVRNFDFINYDDPDYVRANQRVQDGLTWDGVVWAFTSGYAANWHPVTWLSLMLDCQLFGDDAGWIHLVNVFWHLINTLLLLAVLKKMTGALWPSVFVAAAFGLHPMHVESVAWIAERKDVLSTFFLLLALGAYTGYVKRPSVFRYLLSVVLFALGLMAKPMLVTLPFVMLLLDYWPLNRFEGCTRPENKSGHQMRRSAPATAKRSILYRLIIEKVPFLALSAVSSTVTFLVQQSGGAVTGVDVIGVKVRVINAAIAYFEYIRKMFRPDGLAVFYPLDMSEGIPYRKFTLCILLLVGVTMLVVFPWRRRRYLLVGWLWFVGTLVPVIGLVQVGAQAYADRYSYIPYIGLFIMIAWGLPEFLLKWPYRKVVLGASMAIVLMALGLCCHRQVSYWKNSFTLFSHAAQVTQNNSLAYNNMGVEYGKSGRYPEAIGAYKLAVKIRPDYATAYYNLGAAYGVLARREEAIAAYRQAIKIKPDYADAYNNLGVAYSDLGRYHEAIEAHKQAIKIKPDDGDSHNNLGVAYNGLGCYNEAMEAFNQAIKIRPDDAKAYNNLFVSYGGLGRYRDAIEALKQVIRIEPDAQVYNSLGNAYQSLGSYAEAIEAYKQAVRLKPEYAEAYNNLGNACYSLGSYPEAVEALKQVTRIKADDGDAYNNLGVVCSGLGRYSEAIESFRQAIKLKPDFAGTHLNLGLACLKVGDIASAMEEYRILKTLNKEMADTLFSEIDKFNQKGKNE